MVEFEGQEKFPLWENIHLIEAENSEEASAKSLALGKKHEDLEWGSSHCDDKPARMVFCGVRKLIEVMEDKLESGIELTYVELEVSKREQIQDLLEQKAVTLIFDEPCTSD
ncbi:MAG: DUF4288 domain-containing protein [Candidatus Eremiobacteraeota bacterium]|nr:DUF4288 domain-containing protein [Candidatus Eremiobacteraeota bacterium]